MNAQKQKIGKSIGELLIEMGMIKEEDFSIALAAQLAMPYASYVSGLLTPKKDQGLEKLVDYEFAKKNLVLPLSKHHAFFDLRGI